MCRFLVSAQRDTGEFDWPRNASLQAASHHEGGCAMSTKDEQAKKTTTVTKPAEKQRQEESGREDPVEPDEVGSAKETTTVRGRNESQSVRRSA
jgi:hypothetical protein